MLEEITSTTDEERTIEEYNQIQRDRQPLLFCEFITKRPKTAFGLTLAGHLTFLAINGILALTDYDVFPADFQSFPVQLYGELVAQREYAWAYRNQDPDHIKRIVVDDLGPTWDRGYSADDVMMYFTRWNKNVFTKESLQTIEQCEYEIFNLTDYQTKFCQLDEKGKCIKANSVIRYFDGTYRHISEIFYDPHFENIEHVIYTAYKHPATAESFRYFLGKGYRITPEEAFVDLTRSSTPMGWPLEGNQTTKEKQRELENFILYDVQDAILRSIDEHEDTIEICYFSIALFGLTVISQAVKDLLLALGSLGFIFCFIWFQTKSLWITGWAVLSIMTSFWTTNLIYRVVFDFRYIGYFHMIAIFIILGIGADDFFIFYNSWQETATHIYQSEAHRLSDCYRRSAGTMFFTSFTTMMAFLVGGFSPVLPIGTFGIFTGILIGVNYISVIVFFPTVVYTYHLYYKDSRGIWCCKRSSNKPSTATIDVHRADTDQNHETNVAETFSTKKTKKTNMVTNQQIQTELSIKSSEAAASHQKDGTTEYLSRQTPEDTAVQQASRLSRFFRGPYVDFITHPISRCVIITGFLVLLGFMAWSSTYLEIDPEEIKIYRANTNYGKAMRYGGSGFIPSGDAFVILHLVWGMQPRDYSDCHKTDYQCPGEQIWDDYFDLNTPPAQFALKDFCHKLKYNLTEDELEKLMIRNNTDGSGLAVDCFVDNLEVYLQEEQARFNDTIELSYPLKESNMNMYMASQPLIYEQQKLPNTFYRYFEVGLGNWMNNRYSMLSTPDFIRFDALVGENKDGSNTLPVKFHSNLFNETLAYYGTKLRYAAIRVNLSLSTQELSYVVGLPVMNDWEEFFNSQLMQMPPALQGAFQQTDITWHWLTIQKTLAENAVRGIIAGLIIALPVLIMATLNWIVGIFATLNICFVSICVLGMIPIAGWKLDVMISMNLCLLVGLSVDYIVHIAEGYHLSLHSTREMRVRDSLGQLGTSVLSGSVTTLGAAAFMMFGKIQFFLQFGTFLLCTIGFSLMFSMVFFCTVMSIIGPQGSTGSILPPIRWLKNRFIGRSKTDTDCIACEGRGFISTDVDEFSIDKYHYTADSDKNGRSNGNMDELSCGLDNPCTEETATSHL